jgi:excinuclease ABC subunit C
MEEAADAERYEEAGRHRDLIRAIEASVERQLVVDSRGGSRDLWGLYRSGDKGLAALLPVRAGRMEEAIELPFDGVVGEDGELLSSLINAWYSEADEIPAEVVLPLPPPDLEALGMVLAERRGAAVHLRVPQRGEKLRMVEVAQENARSAYARRESEEERKERALEELRRVCQLQQMPRRIECFDNSNIQGTDPVASMVVYVDGRPARPLWRRYRVKTVVGADDFASMREILGRRIRRGLEEGDLPDLIVVDGGKGQVSAAAAIFEEFGLIDQRRASTQGAGQRPVVGLCGLAKPRTEHARGDREATDKIVLPGVMNPLRLHANSPALHLLQAIRDDTHDAALRYHRQVRDRRNLTSTLDALPGIGPARRKALLQHLGSLSAVMEASEEQLAAVPGIGAALAASIHHTLRKGEEE